MKRRTVAARIAVAVAAAAALAAVLFADDLSFAAPGALGNPIVVDLPPQAVTAARLIVVAAAAALVARYARRGR